ncbi:MAG TPA: hypothetical protein VEQ65_03460, partial [Opitutus sp.]|nr:hypothetical protein [Opitutus sp.]
MNSALLHRRWSTLHLAAACLASASLGYVLVRDRSRDFREANPSTAPTRLANSVQPVAASTQPESAASSAASPSSSVPAAPSVDTIAVTWRQLSQIERTPASERAMADFIEQLALADSARALALANAEPNWRTRRDLTHAVLRGWATGSARAAAEWAGTLPEAERSLALQAVFAGAAQRPNDAIRVARELSAANPQMAGDYGQGLVTGLSEAGDFEAAVNFAAADVSEHRAGWLHAT